MTRRSNKPDYFFIGLVGVIVLFGLVMLSSASSAVGYNKFGDNYWYLKHQVFYGLLPGIVVFLIFLNIDYRKFRKLALPFLIISIIALILVFIPGLGADYGRARNWINIFGVSVQPAEIVKLTFLIYLAAWLGDKIGTRKMEDASQSFIPFITTFGLIVFLIAAQPDLGTLSIIVVMAISVYFAAGAPLKHMAIIGSGGILMFLALIKIAPYRAARLMTFLNPGLDPQGVGYHINQALLAIGSGGIFGLGLGLSRQKFQYLPEVAGDSIFAIISEELGFIFAVGLIIAFILLALRGYRIAKTAPDGFGRLLAVGVTSWFVFQAFINIGAMLSLMPLTGVPLPFVSYGGTALTINLAAVGIVGNISRYCKS